VRMRLLINLCLFSIARPQAAIPRNVRVRGQQFVLSRTNASIVLAGPNVVVKGPPYLPSVSGDTMCNDVVNKECWKLGTCTSCYTFNQADVDHIKSMGWNFIRLGVVWAGAQPRDENALDPDFLKRLHAVLNLTDANGLHVMLDNHGDMVGSAGCGNGAPMWFQKRAAPELIGKPLETPLPYSLIPYLDVERLNGSSHCGKDPEKWKAYAGDPNYNLLNECCQAINVNFGNPGALGYTRISQETMNYAIRPGEGRDLFVRYWRLMAEAVKHHPSAFAAELMNEPMTIRRKWMFDTWRASAEAINEVIPDMSVSICDIGESSQLPWWITDLPDHGAEDIPEETTEWIKSSNNAFYAWHYGHEPSNVDDMQAISKKWNVPTFATETACKQFNAAKAAGISHSYWHYSSYCNTGPAFGNRQVPGDTFGACILGWAGGNSTMCPSPVTTTLV